ncbi:MULTISPECIES: NfeD family protein [unclassified Microcoleus]|nr:MULTISPECIES: NfeD family protein [unclassified Microcoleus]
MRPGESGRVRFQSTWWPAKCDLEITLKPGAVVRVLALENMTLIVEA